MFNIFKKKENWEEYVYSQFLKDVECEIDSYFQIEEKLNSESNYIQNILKKAKEAKELGLNRAKEISIAQEIKEQQNLLKIAKHYKSKYPKYKFITEQSVNKICEKYGLVFKNIDKYIGPTDDNITGRIKELNCDIKEKKYYASQLGEEGYGLYYDENTLLFKVNDIYNKPVQMKVIALAKDFGTVKKSNFKVFKPVILKPVIYENIKYYLI